MADKLMYIPNDVAPNFFTGPKVSCKANKYEKNIIKLYALPSD